MTVPGDARPEEPPSDEIPPAFGAEWPTRAADVVDGVVAAVHDRIIRPVMLAARGVVFGLIIGVVGVCVLVLFCIMALRFLDIYVSNGHVWISYFILGSAFSVAGLVCWYLRTPRGDAARDA